MAGRAVLCLLFLVSRLAADSSTDTSVHLMDLSGDLSSALSELYDSQSDCDFLIHVEWGRNTVETLELCTHSLVLSLNSEAKFLLRNGGNSSTIRVDEECLIHVKEFVRYLYTRRIEIILSSVKCFHKIASMHGAHKLQEYCAQLFSLLIPEDPTFKAQLDLYNYAISSQDPLLEQLCLQFLSWNCEAFSQSEAWVQLRPHQLQALLSRSDVVIQDEISLLRALERWRASNNLEQYLLEGIRFPMISPGDLFQLQFNLTFYSDFKDFFRSKELEALQFHTVPLQILDKYVNMTEVSFIPRIYTSLDWSHQVNTKDANPYYRFDQSFQTSIHPSFLFKTQQISWSMGYYSTLQSCLNYGWYNSLSCSSYSFPLLSLNYGMYYDSAIRYENKVLMMCQGTVITAVQDFKDRLVMVPNTFSGLLFPCPSEYSSFTFVVRPLYAPTTPGQN